MEKVSNVYFHTNCNGANAHDANTWMAIDVYHVLVEDDDIDLD